MSIKGTYGDPKLMSKLASYHMPFGKHASVLLIDLPQTYLNWFCKIGFPQSELGELMRIVHETNANGMQHFFSALRQQKGEQSVGEPMTQLSQDLPVSDTISQASYKDEVVAPMKSRFEKVVNEKNLGDRVLAIARRPLGISNIKNSVVTSLHDGLIFKQ